MNQLNKIVIGIVFFAMLCAMPTLAVTSVAPASGGAVNGSYNFTATAGLPNTISCNWSTTTDGIFANSINTSASTTFSNLSVTTSLTEAHDTTLTINCSNLTGDTEQTTLTISVDNTAPVCSFTANRNSIQKKSNEKVSTTQASTDTTDLTYSWTLWDKSGNADSTSTSTEPTFSGSLFDEDGTFVLGLVVTDEAVQKTTCSNVTIKASGGGNLPKVSESKAAPIVVGFVVIFVLMIVVAFFLMKKK